MRESGGAAKGVKVGHYFIYDLDDRVIYPRIGELGKDLKIKGQTYAPAKIGPLAFGAVVSDRRVYNPGDVVRLLIASPGCGRNTAHLEVMFAGKRAMTSDDFTLDDYGVYVYELRGAEETGEYTAAVTTTSERKIGKATEAERKTFSCDFTIAQHTLSPMLAQIKKQVISGDALDAEFEMTVLNQPYTGSVRIGLYCEFCKVVVEEKSFDAKNGSLGFQWRLSGHTGPFRLEFSTPDGNTASVTLQSTRVEERQEIQVGNLGEIVNMALVPIPDGRSLRGINWAPRGASTTPVIVRNAESEKIEVQVTRNLDYLSVYTVNPFTGEARQASKASAKEGLELSFDNSAPYQIVFVGCMINADESTLFEGRSVVFHPETLKLQIRAPEKAEPGEEVTITLESNRKAECLLMVFDERLDTENITGKLGKDIYNHLRALPSIQELMEQFIERKEVHEVEAEEAVRPLAHMMAAGAPMAKMAAPPPSFSARSPTPAKLMAVGVGAYNMADRDKLTTVITTTVQAAMTVTPRRAWFPKLLAYKLIEMDGVHEERIKLGDTITRWKVQVYAFTGVDYISKSASVEADKSVVVDLDIPSMIDYGDEYYGKAIYHLAEGKGSLRIRLPDGSSYEGEVEGDGIRDFKLPGPGVVEAELTSTIGSDLMTKEVNAQASERVTVSALSMLEENEELQIGAGKRVFVYGSVKAILTDSVRALVQYPYGCAEQTSAKLCGLAVAWKFGETSQEITQMISSGLSRMAKFLQQDGMYSLWEGAKDGSPDVTRKVLKNLAPLMEVEKFKMDTAPLVERPIQELVKRDVHDNALLPLNEKFAAPMSTVEDAANIALHVGDKGKRKDALKLIESRAIEGAGGSEVHWEASQSTWGGSLETTATALRVLGPSNDVRHQMLFKKGFKFVAKRLVAGRLNSTADTRALIELFATMEGFDSMPKFAYFTHTKDDPTRAVTLTEKDYGLDSRNVARTIALDDEAGSDQSSENRRLRAGTKLLVRLDGVETIDYKKIKSMFNFEAKLPKTTLKLGERVQLSLVPKDHSICPIAKVFLAANMAFLEGGVNIQTISKPLTDGGIVLDILATAKGRCKLYTIMYDMYDVTMIGVAVPIQVTTL
ncbi:MAG: alpha-2-macroglobulin family protein [Promethearchaeati archaeon SRVP18_Atabeyarchaeia-1]